MLSTLKRNATKPLVRFDFLSEGIVKSVREACTKHNVLPVKATSHSTDVQSTTAASPGTRSSTKRVQAVGKQLSRSSNGSGQPDGNGCSSGDAIAEPTAPAAAEMQATLDASLNILSRHGTLDRVAAKAMMILESVMEKDFAFYCVDSEELVDAHKRVLGGSLSLNGRVQLAISDAPYHIRDTEYDCITQQKMVSSATDNYDCLHPVGHLIFFCSGFKFPIWYKILNECTYVDADRRMKKSFTVDKKSLFVLAPSLQPDGILWSQ